jgi:hypothetical protein
MITLKVAGRSGNPAEWQTVWPATYAGSSLKVVNGSSGVWILFLQVFSPVEWVDELTKIFLFRLTAKALMVKSRRFWSSSRLPGTISGLRAGAVTFCGHLRTPRPAISVGFLDLKMGCTEVLEKMKRLAWDENLQPFVGQVNGISHAYNIGIVVGRPMILSAQILNNINFQLHAGSGLCDFFKQRQLSICTKIPSLQR